VTDIVEAAWRKMMNTAGEPSRPASVRLLERFTEVARVAYAEPRLRQLYPWTGMWELHFSRCTEFRPTWDIPYIGMMGRRYRVEGPLRTSPRIAETDSAQAAVEMVVERLPPRSGPAFVGSAEELAAYERVRYGK
jgi:hypothetical protein